MLERLGTSFAPALSQALDHTPVCVQACLSQHRWAPVWKCSTRCWVSSVSRQAPAPRRTANPWKLPALSGAGMERGFSADDLSLMLKLQGGPGFPRTDSEAAFMDFLKRIPSTSNLAAQASAQGLDAAQQQQLVQTAQQMQAAQAQSGLASSSSLAAPLPGTLQEVGRLNVGGIPRVPSLDLLRQLVQVNQSMSPGGGAKAMTSAPGAHLYPCVSALRVRPVARPAECRGARGAESAALEGAPSSRGLTPPASAVLPMPATVPMVATTLLPVPPAAAPVSLRHSSTGHSGQSAPCTDSESGGGGTTKEGSTKAEIRRARRSVLPGSEAG